MQFQARRIIREEPHHRIIVLTGSYSNQKGWYGYKDWQQDPWGGTEDPGISPHGSSFLISGKDKTSFGEKESLFYKQG